MKRLATSIFALLVVAPVAAVAVAVAVAAGGAADAGSLPVAHPSPLAEMSTATITPTQAAEIDARAYAEIFDVTPAQARQRLTAQDAADESLARLEEQFPGSFAGGWIEHQPAFRAVARFKGAVPPGAHEIAGDVVLRPGATRSLAELDGLADRIFDDLPAAGWNETLVTAADVETGTVEVSIEVPAELKGATKQQLRSLLPASARAADVHVAFSNAPVTRGEHTYAGATTTSSGDSCTTGFTVFLVSSGAHGVLTAGHCDNDRDYVQADDGLVYDTDWQDGHRGDWGDFQWHTTDHTEFAEFYSSDLGRREVHGYDGTISKGDFFCKYGRTTGYGCSTVHDKKFSATDADGFHLKKLVAMDAHITDGGDSGGPWFLNNDAVGVHAGAVLMGGVLRSDFSRITYIDDAMGVGLLVAP